MWSRTCFWTSSEGGTKKGVFEKKTFISKLWTWFDSDSISTKKNIQLSRKPFHGDYRNSAEAASASASVPKWSRCKIDRNSNPVIVSEDFSRGGGSCDLDALFCKNSTDWSSSKMSFRCKSHFLKWADPEAGFSFTFLLAGFKRGPLGRKVDLGVYS